MKNGDRPTNKQLMELDRQAAIDEAVGDCSCVSSLLLNELDRDVWNSPGRDVEILRFLARQMAENLQELEARIAT